MYSQGVTTMPAYLKKRGHKYYVQVSVPRPLQKTVGSAKIIRTTGESDLRLAERKKYQIIADIKRDIEIMVDNDPSSPTWLERQAIGIRKAVTRGDIDEQIANDIIGTMRDRHLKARSQSPEDQLPDSTESRLATVTRLASDLSYQPLSGLVKDYLDEKEPHVQPSTLVSKRRALDAFTGWLREDSDINEINRKVAGRYVSDVLVKNGKHPKTNIDTVATLSAFFNWTANRGVYDHSNPWTGMARTLSSSKRGSNKGPRMWTRDELSKLFTTVPSGEKYYLKELSAIALYTGMRQNEIAELEVSDIDIKAKVIDIGEGKTESSVRVVPIHPAILSTIKRLVKDTDSTYLFPTLKPAGRDRKRGHEPSKRFGYWRDQQFPGTLHEINVQGHKRSEVNFHSFRRSFINACEQAGIPEPTTKQLVGHSKPSLTYGTYSRGVDLKLLREAIGKVSFGAVDKLVR